LTGTQINAEDADKFKEKSAKISQICAIRQSQNRKFTGHESCIIILVAVSRVPCYYVVVIRSFKTAGTEDIFNGKNTKAARHICPQNVWKIASRKLDQLDSVNALDQLRIPPGTRLEALTGDRKGQHSIRINDQYRICFVWAETEPDEVDIVDYH
jgi:proteic killer suppression protein